ncbi:hypothetical protein OIU76_019458 [Salix suchowensis]|nr:hypothetical protein OIU76_019458 [Salix suchowensis]
MLKKTAAEGVHAEGIVIGAIIDMSSRIGKEQRAAMEIAVEDFNGTGNQTLVLHIKDSQRDPVRAALAAMDLINNQQVQAILGPQTWEEVLSVAEISSQTQVPILSLADTTPRWASERWPYLLQASPNKQEQMKAIAAVVQSGNWHQANEMKMMGKDYVWIATSPVTSLVHSNASIISSSKQGIIGVKSCFPEGGHPFRKLRQRFEGGFSIENPKDESNEPGIYAAEAYDAVWTLAVAVNGSNRVGQELLGKILQVDFNGLSGKVQFIKFINERAPADKFHIINITEKGYKELGFWSKGSGFSKTIHENSICSSCMTDSEQALTPEAPRHNSRGWRIATSANPLRVGVPGKSGYREFVNVTYDHLGNSVSISGFAIKVFNETIKRLPFDLPYEFIAFNNSSYDELVKQIYLKKYDAVVGDVVLLARRYQYAEFTNPYTETGLMLIVPAVSGRREWSFITPFTKSMWVLIAVITVYNGFIIWLIERNHCPTLKGSTLHQIGIVLWLAFNTLFSLHGKIPLPLAFPRGSPLLPSIDEALLDVYESGTLLELENRYIKPEKCPEVEDENQSLSPDSFGTLFILTTGTSTISLAIYIFSRGISMLGYKITWRLMLAAMRYWVCQKQITRRFSNAEISVNFAPHAPGTQSLV